MGNELEAGQTLDDRFQITDQISRSGMASIFKAIDKTSGRTIAIKVPTLQFESDPGFYSRFQREQKIGQTLNHPYILRLETSPENQSRPYLVMEFLEGQTLGHIMRSLRPMPAHEALRIASQVCEALEYMHEHEVVHRDLKPENIMICNDGTIRIMDFGIAKYDSMRRLTFGGFTPAMGTPDYMAPEQVQGKRGDARTDIYSLGAILYEMVTGVLPFTGADPFIIMNARLTSDPVAPRKRNLRISIQVEEIILHAMARNPLDRYPTAFAMKVDLDEPSRVVVTGRAKSLVAPAAHQHDRRGARLAVLMIAISLAIIGIVIALRNLRWR